MQPAEYIALDRKDNKVKNKRKCKKEIRGGTKNFIKLGKSFKNIIHYKNKFNKNSWNDGDILKDYNEYYKKIW